MPRTKRKTSLSFEKHFRQWIAHWFRHATLKLVVLVAIELLSIGVLLLTPWPLKILVDSVFGKIAAPGILANLSPVQLLYVVAAAYVLLYILGGIIGIVDKYLSTRYTVKLGQRLKTAFFRHIFSLRRPSRQKVQSGDYVYRLNTEVDYLPVLIFSTTTALITNVITIIVSAAVLLLLNPELSVYSLLIVPLLYGSIRFFTPKIGRLSTKIEVSSSAIYNHSSESIDNVEIIQAYNREDVQTKALNYYIDRQNRLELKSNLLESGFDFANNLFTSIGVGLIVAIGGMFVMNGRLSLGELLIFITYMSYFYDPLEGIVASVGTYKSLLAGLKRVFSVVREPGVDTERTAPQLALERTTGQIDFDGVSLWYGDRRVLNEVSFSIKPGQKVAFIGPSGSGKTSILSLLMGYIKQTSGTIRFNGHDAASIDLRSIREQIAIVTQESALLSGTVKDNIAFGVHKQPSMEQLKSAADAANATEFIAMLPDYFNSPVGESGNKLSGGQKQRIAIARSFVKDAPIILLDEPTSSQDFESATKIVAATKELMKGKTVLMVSHELSLLKEMDVVYVVSKGGVLDVSAYGGLETYMYRLLTHPEAPR